MKLNYDNLEDAKVKLTSTYCYHKDKAIVVKVISQPDPSNMKFMAHCTYMSTGRPLEFYIDDKDFNCSVYNIGYINLNHAAAWFYRIPFKQWRQGLKHDQVRMRASRRLYADISFQSGKAVAEMMENIYPNFKTASNRLKDGDANIVAFHRDFAVTLDRIHNDFILEYKGVNIGFSKNLKDFELMQEFTQLTEALKEVVE